jgi:hypothetical protein
MLVVPSLNLTRVKPLLGEVEIVEGSCCTEIRDEWVVIVLGSRRESEDIVDPIQLQLILELHSPVLYFDRSRSIQ